MYINMSLSYNNTSTYFYTIFTTAISPHQQSLVERLVVTMGDADEVVLIYLVPLDRFLRFLAHHLALINPSISSH